MNLEPVFRKIFRIRIKIRLKFPNELFLENLNYFPFSVQDNLIFVFIDMVNDALNLKCVRLK